MEGRLLIRNVRWVERRRLAATVLAPSLDLAPPKEHADANRFSTDFCGAEYGAAPPRAERAAVPRVGRYADAHPEGRGPRRRAAGVRFDRRAVGVGEIDVVVFAWR